MLIPGLLISGCNGGGEVATATDTGTSSGTTAEPTGATTGSPTSSPTTTSDTGTASATEGTSATTSGSTTEVTAGSSGEPGTATTGGGTTGGATTGGGTTGGETTGGETTGDTSTGETTGETTTGGVMGCGFAGPEVDATLVHLDNPPPPCGTLTFEGRLDGPDGGPTYQLDACPCGANCLVADPWSFTIDVPEMLPEWMPMCPRIVVQRQLSKMGCELVGAAIFDTQAPDQPFWVAGSLLGPLDAVKAKIEVAQKVVEECDCDGCCNVPQRLDLVFTALNETQTIPEDSMGAVGSFDAFYSVRNFQSHLTGLCDASPSIDYVMQLVYLP